METEHNKKYSVFQIALNLTLASMISGGVLALAYFITEPFAIQQRARLEQMILKELVSRASAFQHVTNKEGWFAAVSNGSVIAYVIPADGKGYGGTIRILLAAGTNGEIIDYKILSHNETPGLGDKTALTNFRSQFRGKKTGSLEVVKNHDTNKIDAITGATISSRAVTKAIRESMERLDEFLGVIK